MKKIQKLIIDQNVDIDGLKEVNKDQRIIGYNNTVLGADDGWIENRRIQIQQKNKTKS